MLGANAAGMRVTTWKEGAEGTRYEMRYEMPRTSGWRFHVWSGSALLSLDDYSEATLNLGTSDARIVGKHYEDTPSVSLRVKRYYAGGTLLATRLTYYGPVPGSELTYVQGDHLGSTSTLTNWAGAVVARERYSAFGERRRSDNAAITDQLYTGQRLNVLSGLYHYSDGGSAGRFYDPLLARFVQADSVTPPGSQGLNRYSHTFNNPIKYTDPGGHDPLDQEWQNSFHEQTGREPAAEDILIRLFSLAYSEEWQQLGWSTFYDENNQYRAGSIERVFRDSVPAERSWETVPDALEALAAYYLPGEEGMFTRDIGSLFGGLANRLEVASNWAAFSYGGNPVRTWVEVGPSGLPGYMLDDNRDANIHHWAWGLAGGGAFGPIGSLVNTGREILQFRGNLRYTWADIAIGNTGAALGANYRVMGLQPQHMRQVWNAYMLGQWGQLWR